MVPSLANRVVWAAGAATIPAGCPPAAMATAAIAMPAPVFRTAERFLPKRLLRAIMDASFGGRCARFARPDRGRAWVVLGSRGVPGGSAPVGNTADGRPVGVHASERALDRRARKWIPAARKHYV